MCQKPLSPKPGALSYPFTTPPHLSFRWIGAYQASNGYIVSEQGKPPDFVLEVASESTGATDTGAKRQDYAALGISEYWRFDETGQHHGVRLAGDQFVGDRYRPITIEQLPDGTLQGYSPALNLFLHWQDGQLLWIDPATQQPILTYEDQLSRAEQADARIRQAAARISELENEVRRLRGQ